MWANDKKKEEEKKQQQKQPDSTIDDMIANGKAIKITNAKDAVKVLKSLAEAMDNNDPETAKKLLASLGGPQMDEEEMKKANEIARKIQDEAFKLGASDTSKEDMLSNVLALVSAAIMKAHCDTCAEEMLYRLANTIIDLPVKRVRKEAREKGIEPSKEEKNRSDSLPD